ncbi:MAG: hypothetical protein QN229_05955 [Desulfurococcaceae archaeon TW002]
MRGLSNLVIVLLLLIITVPASVLLVSKVREYADVVRNQARVLQPVTLAAYILRDSNQDLLILCNYGRRIIKNIYIIDSAGNRMQVLNIIEPKTCYQVSLPVRNWYSVIAGGQLVSVLRVS